MKNQMKTKLKWINHGDLSIKKNPSVRREEYLDYMTFKANTRPLFTEIFGPIVGLKEEWLAQGATPEELDFSAFRYRCPMKGRVPVNTDYNEGGYECQNNPIFFLLFPTSTTLKCWNIKVTQT